ncbi:MAG: macro domain-containing protein [Actinomycetota bacterium]|nr:macro domain-containing protein [Actinomycetota bacterium]
MDAFALKRIGGTNVIVTEGDVTRQAVEAVVNATNESLHHTVGVATAVVRTGGRIIQEESDTWVREHGPLEPGQAAVTTGGMLEASHVIHVAGPYYEDGANDEALAAAARAALNAAQAHGLSSVAMPAISTGKRGYPVEVATTVIVDAIARWLEEHPDTLTEIRLVGFSRENAAAFASALTS